MKKSKRNKNKKEKKSRKCFSCEKFGHIACSCRNVEKRRKERST